MRTFTQLFEQLAHASDQGPAAKSVECFGWLILIEGAVMLFAPHFVASILRLPDLTDQAANYLRLVGLLAGGVGMLYVVSGRTNAEGFIFASLLDRPLVPFVMAALWSFGLIPAPLAIAFAIQDFGSFLWTLAAWRAERRILDASRIPVTR
jgi:uncharacterized protein YjeT (DUF2065 family)